MAAGGKYIQKLKIENFRSLQDLEIDHLSNFNLFIGDNNIGKTSVLEALAFSGGIYSKEFLNSFSLEMRQIPISSTADFPQFYHNFDTNKPIRVTMELRETAQNPGSTRILESKIQHTTNLTEDKFQVRFEAQRKGKTDAITLEIESKEPNTQSFSAQNGLVRRQKEMRLTFVGKDIDIETIKKFMDTNKPVINFIRKHGYFLPEDIDALKDRDIRSNLLNFIQKIEPRIDEIHPGEGTLNCYYKGISKPFFLSLLGVGFIKIVKLYLAILTEDVDVLLFDEIADGLSPQTVKVMLQCILPLLAEHKIQLFATTHSADIIKTISEYTGQFQDLIALHYLYRDEKDTQVQPKIHYYSAVVAANQQYFADIRIA